MQVAHEQGLRQSLQCPIQHRQGLTYKDISKKDQENQDTTYIHHHVFEVLWNIVIIWIFLNKRILERLEATAAAATTTKAVVPYISSALLI